MSSNSIITVDEYKLKTTANPETSLFNEREVLHQLKHYLPAQAPLKDFIHHNTLHAFQHRRFDEALLHANQIFGFSVTLPLDEFRALYHSNRIGKDILEAIVAKHKGTDATMAWIDRMLHHPYDTTPKSRVGRVRQNWKKHYAIDIDSIVHPILFRVVGSYLDQGISMWHFPIWHKGFLPSIREMERNSFTSFFRTKRARNLLLTTKCELSSLLQILVGDEALFEHYLYDQQFAHQGWSGMVSAIEDQPHTLLDPKKISLHDLILFELLLEIDAMDYQFGTTWKPLAERLTEKPQQLFVPVPSNELHEVLMMFQQAYEWSYYDEVLGGIQKVKSVSKPIVKKSFQAMFCIDDRECSFRRYLEQTDPNCETFGTPGFFSVEFFFKPEDGKFFTKLCPAPVTPKYLIKEVGAKDKKKKDLHLHKHSHSLFRGWLITHPSGYGQR